MNSDFVHLHVHSDYSMLDGACSVKDLTARAAEWGMPAIALTDHGNMCGAVEFYQAAQEAGVKPIIGCELYVAPSHRTIRNAREPHNKGFHLVLLARDNTGYRNLCALNAIGHLEGYYYNPRVDKESLAAHSEGLIALTACVGGEVPARLLENDEGKATEALHEYLDIFGRDNFYLELQNHQLEKERVVLPRMIELSRRHNVPLVATNDSHYLERDHAEAHEVLLCIQTQTTVEDPGRMQMGTKELYLKSAQEMAELFHEIPEALQNTAKVAERCNVRMKVGDDSDNHYPVYEIDTDEDRETYLRNICLQGMKERYGFDPTVDALDGEPKKLMERMDYELGIIAKTGFTSYFLVVWDFLDFARKAGVPVGPGRGSGAGSIVAYLTHITDIDPIRYGLLFERFLNPDRVSPPDFDIDLCERRRQEVIGYVREKYGAESVAQIGTFGTLKAKAVIKDVGRALGCSFNDVNAITRLVPADPKMTLDTALEKSPELQQLAESEEWVGNIFRHSKVLEGLNRNMSIHAAGVIIGDQPLADIVPLCRGAGDEVITQYSAGPCEDLGLLKMDFLGLRTLTIIQDALDLIAANRGVSMSSSEIPLGDGPTFELLNHGNTVCVFQLESSGMRDLCRRFGVNRLEDIIALIALYRPGPMQFLEDFIERKRGAKEIDYDVPSMKPILEETYGIMLYQEQVMQVVQTVAGFSLGQADILRRAMGKKKIKVMEKMFGQFIEGCQQNGIDEDLARQIWDKIVLFAGYGFNKSHSAAYAMLSYRTAYLKANHPVEYMAAVLSSELGNAEKLAAVLKETRDMGIDVKPPDVQTSGLRFSVDGDSIRFGLGAIKGVGGAAAEAIIEARNQGGPFKDLVEFCERVNGAVNKRVMENLCRAGAFDCFQLRRSQVFDMLSEALAHAQQTVADRAAGQGSLFDLMTPEGGGSDLVHVPDRPEWPRRQILRDEKELLGFYVTGHPLDEYRDIADIFALDRISDLAHLPEETGTRVAGIIADVSVKISKKTEKKWAIVAIEDQEHTIECMVFSKAYEDYADELAVESPVLVEGYASRREGEESKLIVERVIPLEQTPELLTTELHLRIHENRIDSGRLEQLHNLCLENPGDSRLIMCLICENGDIAFVESHDLAVCNSNLFRQTVTDVLGPEGLLQKPNRTRPARKQRRWNSRQNRPNSAVAN